MPESLQIAVFQPEAADRDSSARSAEADAALAAAAGLGAELVVLPELYLSGYHAGDDVTRRAEPAYGPFARAMAASARRHRIAVAYGFPERAEGRVYNAALFIDAAGEVLARHRKTVFPNAYERGLFAAGAGLTTFAWRGWRLGLVICYEIEFPEIARASALAGTELLLAPTALGAAWDVVASRLIPTRAFENGLFICYSDWSGEERGLAYRGGSRIIGPDGRERAAADPQQALIGCTVERGAIEDARSRIPYLRDLEDVRRGLGRADRPPSDR